MGDILRFRNARGDWVEVGEIAATQLKNEPASVIDRVASGGAVAITRHNTPRAVLVSYDDFRRLVEAREPSLDALSRDFDRLLDGMQAPKAKKGLADAFAATPAAIGRNAVAAAQSPRTKAVAARQVKKRPRTRGAA